MARKKADTSMTGVGSTNPIKDSTGIDVDIFRETISALETTNARKLKKFEEQLKKAEVEAQEVKSRYEERIQKVEVDQARVIETIGIFAALLAFVAFEAQVFKGPLSTASLVGLSSIILGGLIIFVLLLDMAFDALKPKRSLRIGLFLLSFFCIFAGFISAYIGYKNADYKEYYNKDAVDHKIEQLESAIQNSSESKDNQDIKPESTNELLEFKNCILKQGLSRCL